MKTITVQCKWAVHKTPLVCAVFSGNALWLLLYQLSGTEIVGMNDMAWCATV